MRVFLTRFMFGVLFNRSTPELDTVTSQLLQGVQMMHVYKPPPPYPINRPSSNSTPDLASQTFAHHSHYFISSQVNMASEFILFIRNAWLVEYVMSTLEV